MMGEEGATSIDLTLHPLGLTQQHTSRRHPVYPIYSDPVSAALQAVEEHASTFADSAASAAFLERCAI